MEGGVRKRDMRLHRHMSAGVWCGQALLCSFPSPKLDAAPETERWPERGAGQCFPQLGSQDWLVEKLSLLGIASQTVAINPDGADARLCTETHSHRLAAMPIVEIQVPKNMGDDAALERIRLACKQHVLDNLSADKAQDMVLASNKVSRSQGLLGDVSPGMIWMIH